MDNVTQTSPLPEPAVPPVQDLTGQTLGDFRVLRKLGQGGMGQVYLAEQLSLKRKVALKILRVDLALDEKALKRFKLEAEAVARVTHANIVQVYAIGEWQGLHFMALEYVEGRNLSEYLARKGTPEVLLALSIMRQVASALQRAGELGIVHRDIKPENILLTRKAEVKVADFGLSRCLEGDRPALNLTQSGVTMGTPLYMSPEQVEGKPLDARTDIYSFGVSCYHMLAGEPPFKGASAFEVALQHVRAEPRPLTELRPDLPPELCAIVHKMMAKDPAQRYQTCRELLRDLAKVREGLSGVTGHLPLAVSVPAAEVPAGESGRPATVPVATARGRRRLHAAFGLSLLLALAAGAGLGVLRQKNRAGDASPASGDEEEARADPGPAVEATPLEKREQERKKMFEQYLDPALGFKDPVPGVRLCLQLALPCLQQNRLKEAEELFARLESVEKVREYQIVGQLGRAIILALRDEAQKSNELFARVPFAADGSRRPASLILLLRSNPSLAPWTARAIHHNHANGIKRKDMPGYLRPFFRAPFLRPSDRADPDRRS